MSEESDTSSSAVMHKGKRKSAMTDSQEDSDSDSDVAVSTRKTRRRTRIRDSESDSSIDNKSLRTKRVKRITSDSDESSDDSSVVIRTKTKRPARYFSENSDSYTDTNSESETSTEEKPHVQTAEDKHDLSDSSDGQSEKCPICLLSFGAQEVGTPETCDHSFCADCIQEWSKNVNTCPVDRQTFTLILVRRNYNGKVIRQIPVDVRRPSVEDLIQEDPTYCEICGMCDREDRLLLCDGCDLGYHLECLDPPMETVPVEEWYCADCQRAESQRLQQEDPGRFRSERILPRTSQSERVRATIQANRSSVQFQSVIDISLPGTSRVTLHTSARRTTKKSTRRTKTTRRKKSYTKVTIVYDIDDATGEKIAIKKRKARRRKTRRRRARRVVTPRTVKKRLATQLGMCAKKTGQSAPGVKARAGGNIGVQRSLAGIPALHLFGQRDQLDYFSDSDAGGADYPGEGVAVASRPRSMSLRRRARTKNVCAPACDILASILDSQEKLHSRNSVISVTKDGTIHTELVKPIKLTENTDGKITQAPMYPNRGSGPGNRPYFHRGHSGNSNNYQNDGYNSNYHFNSNPRFPRPNLFNQNPYGQRDNSYTFGNFQPPFRPRGPPRFPPRRPPVQHQPIPVDIALDEPQNQGADVANPTPNEEIDIYSDIETGSPVQDEEIQAPKVQSEERPNSCNSATEEDSDAELIIDDTVKDPDKYDPADPSADTDNDSNSEKPRETTPPSPEETLARSLEENVVLEKSIPDGIVQEVVQEVIKEHLGSNLVSAEHDDSGDDCPNFSIYSAESLDIAKSSEIAVNLEEESLEAQRRMETEDVPDESEDPKIPDEDIPDNVPAKEELEEGEASEQEDEVVDADATKDECATQNKAESSPEQQPKPQVVVAFDPTRKSTPKSQALQLYDECDLEEWNSSRPDVAPHEPEKLTEAISEEERSYTPCLDEKEPSKHSFSDTEGAVCPGIGGMDTELISDEERNDIFDESHDMKTISDGDALEINAKESELDLARPEDYEEGEIVEKLAKMHQEIMLEVCKEMSEDDKKKKRKKPEKEAEKPAAKEPEKVKKLEFKKLSKSNKDRNYRDKDKARSRSREKKPREDKENRRKKERKKDLERYDVRSIIQDRPKRTKDQFGRDETRNRSYSRSSRSASPSWERAKKKRRRSRSASRGYTPPGKTRRSRSFRRSRSPRKTSRSPRKKRMAYRTPSRERYRRRKSAEKPKPKSRKNRSISRTRLRSHSPTYNRRRSREWSASWSRSPTPRPIARHNIPQSMSPSWTPPLMDKGTVQPEQLTVILNNDVNKAKKRDKKKKAERKTRDEFAKKRKRADRTPPPSKEVFASGDNILVSVSFNKTLEENRDLMALKRKRDALVELSKKVRREKLGKEKKKKSPRNKRHKKDVSGIKPVAIIDLDRSPFKELTPSPKDIIVLSDSDNCEKENMEMNHRMLQEELTAMDSQIQEDSAPQSPNAGYLNSTGPKTPPEPQIKFLLSSKQTQLRNINNPLHDPTDDLDADIDPQEELEQRLNDVLHKGPNTPPEPPTSPPSSPDAYDPFDPTKSRSPTPEPSSVNQTIGSNSSAVQNAENEGVSLDLPAGEAETKQTDADKSEKPAISEELPSLEAQEMQTDPENKPESDKKSPERNQIGVVINQTVQPATSLFSVVTPTVITSTPTQSVPRSNLFTTPASVPQRIILPTPSKLSPAKMSPLKSSPAKPPIKSTPIKPMPSKTMISKLPVPNVKPLTPIRKNQQNNINNNKVIDVDLDFESPYSPGSSDYEDLFEPPAESAKAAYGSRQKSNAKSPAKQNAFDNLFGGSPVYRSKKQKSNVAKIPVKMNKKVSPTKGASNKTHVGVKLDEDNLKILDDLPNSAVEMQVKDKFLKKLNRQERVVEEVKLVLKPHYNKKHVTKEQYKDILRRAVPKICHNKSGEINPKKIQNLIEAYVKKMRHGKKAAAAANNAAVTLPKPRVKATHWS